MERLEQPAMLVNGIGHPMGLYGASAERAYDGARLSISAGAHSDCFFDPAGVNDRFDAPMLLCRVGGDFVLTARLHVEFRSVFDAATLVVVADDANWAKLCFEYSADREPRVVSVVTHGRSDDANGYRTTETSVLARVARRGEELAFHAADADGRFELVRHFALGEATKPLHVGFGAQSPTGDGCQASFDEIELLEHTVADIRSGA